MKVLTRGGEVLNAYISMCILGGEGASDFGDGALSITK